MQQKTGSENSRRAAALIVSAHRLLRESLAEVLARGGRVASFVQCDDPAAAARCLEERPADLVLLDLSRPDAGSAELVRRVRRESTGTRVLLLGVDEPPGPEVLQCIEAGASGSVPLTATLADLERAIERVLEGEAVCPPSVASSMFTRLAELSAERQRRGRIEALKLTPRELEILQLMAAGLRNKTIASRLKLSVHTVKNHVHNVLDKLQVADRNEAVELAYQRGWLEERRRRNG